MAIGDYFHDIEVLQQLGGTNQLGGHKKNWSSVKTISGVINQRASNNTAASGRQGENSEYVGYFEYSDDSVKYIKKEKSIRLLDSDNKIYKLKGKPKNTMGMNHHLKIDLQFVDYLEEV